MTFRGSEQCAEGNAQPGAVAQKACDAFQSEVTAHREAPAKIADASNAPKAAASDIVPSYKDAAKLFVESAASIMTAADPKAAMKAASKGLDTDIDKADSAFKLAFDKAQAELTQNGGGDMLKAIKTYNAAYDAGTKIIDQVPAAKRQLAKDTALPAGTELVNAFSQSGTNSDAAHQARDKFVDKLSPLMGKDGAGKLADSLANTFDAFNPAVKKFVQDVMPYQQVQLLMRDSYSDMLKMTSGDVQKVSALAGQVSDIEHSPVFPRFEQLNQDQLRKFKEALGSKNQALGVLDSFIKQ